MAPFAPLLNQTNKISETDHWIFPSSFGSNSSLFIGIVFCMHMTIVCPIGSGEISADMFVLSFWFGEFLCLQSLIALNSCVNQR